MLITLKKKYAKSNIVFETNTEMSDDGWFIDIKKINKKKSEICSTIIKKDVNLWLNSYTTKGWEIIENK
jgi:hypothetical protein